METEFKAGSLVTVLERDWIIQPSADDDVILLKPLGGTDQEIKGIYKKLKLPEEQLKRAVFPLPTVDQIGNFESSLILYHAARLSFRSGAGPFRSMGKLSFRPRPYQLVPLIMALRLDTVRLLIADDVGVGKTIEALLIVREMLDRGEIKSFAVVCLPHLCDQWHKELKDKFGIEAALVRSSTIKKLERGLAPDETLLQRYPYQVISIDYIKQSPKKELFLSQMPDMLIVDEAHTCAHPYGLKKAQQLRHRLIKEATANEKQHLLLLTATPHSGKTEEFQSILGLLKPSFASIDLITASSKEKKTIAQHFVQRRRKNIEKWLGEETSFPERIPLEKAYALSIPYREVFYAVLQLARKLALNEQGDQLNAHLRYYLAIGLLRGVMSSPATGIAMLQKRLENTVLENEETEMDLPTFSVLDGDFEQEEDNAPTEFTDKASFSSSEEKMIRALNKQLEGLLGLRYDQKAASAFNTLKDWLKTDHTIIFCRYIQTANYLGEILTPALSKVFGKQFQAAVITSELSDEQRKERVYELGISSHRHKLIIATDCMSEGINLQEHFSAVIHYDLPWNPNRLEQREGRVDRFGQPKKEVKTLLLYGEDNPMDGTVLKVLLRKARAIRQAIGISIPFPDDSKSIMDVVLTAVLLNPQKALDDAVQTQINFGEEDTVKRLEAEVAESFDRIQEREKQITSVFAQNAIKPGELTPYLQETQEALGDEDSVQELLQLALPLYHGYIEKIEKGYRLDMTNLPIGLKSYLGTKDQLSVSFDSPTPRGYTYLGRNHEFIEHLCLDLLEKALSKEEKNKVARVAVFRSNQVTERTTLYLLRIRNVIANKENKNELVAEEMKLWGFKGLPSELKSQKPIASISLLQSLQPSQEVSQRIKEQQLTIALEDYKRLKASLDQLAKDRADHMVQGHEQFRKSVNGDHYKTVTPVLPPDVLGVYVILPEISI